MCKNPNKIKADPWSHWISNSLCYKSWRIDINLKAITHDNGKYMTDEMTFLPTKQI